MEKEKCFFLGGEEKFKRRKIFGERKNAFLEEKKSRKGKGGKYLEKEKCFFGRRMKTEKEK